MIGANEGEVLSTADALWPLALLYLVSCGASASGSLRCCATRASARAKEEEDDRDLVALEGHEGSAPGEQDWLVVAFFLLVASYLGGWRLETGAARSPSAWRSASAARRAPRRCRGGSRAPTPRCRSKGPATKKAWRRVAARGPGGMRRVRRVVSDQLKLVSSSFSKNRRTEPAGRGATSRRRSMSDSRSRPR